MSDAVNDPGERSESASTVQEPVVPAAAGRRGLSATPLLVFAAALLLAVATFGTSLALLVRSEPIAALDEDVTVRTSTPTRAPTAAPSPVRISGAVGTAERLETGAYRVTFTWTLEGGREGDGLLLRFSVGSRVLTEQRGTLDATVFTSSTGRLTLATSQECSADGWSAEVVSVRGVTPAGDAVSRVAGVTCR
jgi:hypothetical protein